MNIYIAQGLNFSYIFLVPILDNPSHDFPYYLDSLYLQFTFCFIYCFPQLVI